MLIELTKVLEQDDKVIRQEAHLELEDMEVSGKKYRLEELEPALFEITNLGKKQVQVKGCAKIKTVIPCDRCLEDVEQIFDLDFEREVDLKLDEEGRRQSDDEYNFMEGNCLDTDVLICNELLVNWPIRVLCKEDCNGLCSICGANLNHGECGCDREVLDPRMAAFQDIFSKFKEV